MKELLEVLIKILKMHFALEAKIQGFPSNWFSRFLSSQRGIQRRCEEISSNYIKLTCRAR
jgi:hypothetical protein